METCDKLLSGRLWLTIISGLVFAYSVYARILNAEATGAIITMVFVSYFNRDKTEDNKKNGVEVVKKTD